jgi:hypothetical protein
MAQALSGRGDPAAIIEAGAKAGYDLSRFADALECLAPKR